MYEYTYETIRLKILKGFRPRLICTMTLLRSDLNYLNLYSLFINRATSHMPLSNIYKISIAFMNLC